MSLIVEYHVIADMYPIGGNIEAGMVVTLNGEGEAVAATGSANEGLELGIAGDSRLASAGQTTAYSSQVYVGADGAGTRWTQNRVSDVYDETAASQKITVYNGGGKFWISSDLFESDATFTPGNLLMKGSTAGYWDDGATAGNEIAIVVGASQDYPSGVPGTDVDGSMSLGTYVPVVCRM